MQKLTQAELEIMQALWKLERGYLKDIQKESKDRAHTTVSTILRILKDKGFVSINSFGKANEYFPLIAKDKYTRFYVNNFINQYFDGSIQRLISFLNTPKET
jgi:BlaI family penicillinase repressor